MKSKCAAIVVLVLVISSHIEAQRRAGGSIQRAAGGTQVNRNVANTSIRSNQTVNRSVDRNIDVNRSVNRDIDRDIDVHRDIDVGRDYDRWGHPVARGVAAGVAFGATVSMLPSGCSTVVVNGIGYSQCGSTWYQPYYGGTTVQYVVVMPPQ